MMLGHSTKKKLELAITCHDHEIKLLGKKFTILYELFLPSETSFFSQSQLAVDVWGPDRYKDETSRSKATLAEVYLVLPDHLHPFIRGHSSFDVGVSPKHSTKLRAKLNESGSVLSRE